MSTEKIKSSANSVWEAVPGKKRVLVMMSGGVDSTAAAIMLKEKGWNVAGYTMTISGDRSAITDAEEVCRIIGIPHFYTEIEKEFRHFVSGPFCEAYKTGTTPNPCADCNEHIKFGLLIDLAEEKWGKDFFIATGHYASIKDIDGNKCLARAGNLKKDQSYFMCGIKREHLSRVIFPLNDVKDKEETREFLRQHGISIAEKPESMEICFANEDNYRKILQLPPQKGRILDTDGNVLGYHNGISSYTIGQRKGLGIAAKNPLYVISIKPCDNTVTVAEREKAFCNTVRGVRLNVLYPQKLTEASTSLLGKVRSQGVPAPCRIIKTDTVNRTIEVKFAEPVFAPTPGQRLVLYTPDGIVAAGAVISE